MDIRSTAQNKRYHTMSIDVERILLELEILPSYDDQLSLQVDENGKGAEGQLTRLKGKESDYHILAYNIPYTNSVIESLGMFRSRVMKMKPKTCYSYHIDATKRIHIPLITNENCFFVIEDEIVRLPANGNSYVIDTTKKHTFVNASFEERIHLVGCI